MGVKECPKNLQNIGREQLMCVVTYSSSNIEISAVQEFVLLQPLRGSGEMDVVLNILMNVYEEDATLHLIQRGKVDKLLNLTDNYRNSDDWVNQLINKLRERHIMRNGRNGKVNIKYSAIASNEFSLASFNLRKFEQELENLETTNPPFNRITLANLNKGMHQAARISYSFNFGIFSNEWNRYFQIQGPEVVLTELSYNVRVLNEADQKFFLPHVEEACLNFKKQKYDICVLGNPYTGTTLESFEQSDEHQPVFGFGWSDSVPDPNSSKTCIVYPFSPERLNFSLRFVADRKPELESNVGSS